MAKKKPWPIGRKIVGVRWLAPEELNALGWYSPGMLLMLDDGGFLIPSRDPEGNDSGSLLGAGREGPSRNIYPEGSPPRP